MTNNKVALFVAPHPDDETLGCGGVILKLKEQGYKLHWLIMTTTENVEGFPAEKAIQRHKEIEKVKCEYGFDSVIMGGFPAAGLYAVSKKDLIGAVTSTVAEIRPSRVYVPYRNDVHSDHTDVFDAVISSTKSFRTPFIREIYAYETLSETEFGLRPDDSGFRPNLFEDVTDHLDKKLQIMRLFKGEMGEAPFPRSEENIRALATLRGSQCGSLAAEAFMVLKEVR